LEDCDAILGLKLDEEETLKDFSTLSGFLCMCAGEIPKQGDFVMTRGWCFEVMSADDKKILRLQVYRLVGAFDDESDHDETDNNPLRGFLKRNLGGEHEEARGERVDASDSEVDSQLQRTRELNREMATEVERMVDAGEQNLSTLDTTNEKQDVQTKDS
jgi:hypothetical protein